MAGNNFDFGRVSDPVKKFDQKMYDVSSHIARSTSSDSLRPPVHVGVNSSQMGEVIEKTKADTDKALTNYADTLINKYNEQTRLLIEREASKNSTGRLTHNQTKEITRNLGKLNRLQNDVLTIRRQIEHNESNYKLKSNRVVILKNILYALILIIIVVILKKNFNNIEEKAGASLPAIVSDFGVYNSIIAAIGIFFCSKILFNLYINRNTNSIVFTKYDWDNPTDDEKRDIGVNVPTAPTTGAKAVTCSPGSHVDPYNPALCVLNKCTCPYGIEHEGVKCTEDGKESCKSCIGGYQLLNGVCKSTEPVCQTQSATASTA
jgi:hypothetical protein